MTSAENILEHLLDAVLVVDGSDTIVYANRAAGELFRKPVAELTGQSFGRTTEPGVMQEINLFREGRMHTAEMLVSTIEWNGGEATLLSLRDITATKEAAAELEAQRLELERSNEENAQYASMASHDLREPVRKILVYASMLLDSPGLIDGDRKRVQSINASAGRMRRLIDGIASLSKVNHDRPPFEPVDLSAVLRDVKADLEVPLKERDGRVEGGDLPTIDAVPGEMYQLLLNLIANALKYSRPGVPPLVLIAEASADADWCCFTVTDNGMGFPPEMGPRLFQPFKRLHGNSIEGMGVGLALCYKIVAAHHGTILADGTEGVGAVFTVCLPRIQTGAERTDRDPASGSRSR